MHQRTDPIGCVFILQLQIYRCALANRICYLVGCIGLHHYYRVVLGVRAYNIYMQQTQRNWRRPQLIELSGHGNARMHKRARANITFYAVCSSAISLIF